MTKIAFDRNWIFTDLQTGRETELDLPHDATIGTDRDPSIRNYFLSAGYKGGKYRYEKRFAAPKAWQEKAVWLHFDGVYRNARVFVNGTEAAFREYGYVPFDVRLDALLRFEEENLVRVEIDTPVLAHSRWYAGSGIYRPVTLCVAEKTHIAPNGIGITTLSVSPAAIRVTVETEGGEAEVRVSIFDGEERIAQAEAGADIAIPDAKLWSAETPYLYRAEVELVRGGRVLDTAAETFGIRTISWSAEKGFLINGERTLLRGGCIHADNGVIGMVTNDVTEERRVLNLKAAGFNAIRSAHHPMSPSLLRMCDKYGMYVLDEAWDTWYRMKQLDGDSKHFERTFLEDTAAMILNDRNHPCVVIQSLGNEIPEIGSLKAYRYCAQMIELARSLDGTRPLLVCTAMNTSRAYLSGTPYADTDEDAFLAESEENRQFDRAHYISIYTTALANNPTAKVGNYPQECVAEDEEVTRRLYDALDMAGYNYYTDKFERLHELHPERPIVGTETRANLIVKNWALTRENPYLVGDFIWTLQDHLGEVNITGVSYGGDNCGGRDYPWIVNDSGMIDLLGNLTPAVHRFRFAWGGYAGLYLASQPPVHNGIAPEYRSYKWTDTVESWTYEGYEGEKTFIDVYTDAAEAEIFVNGTSAGRKRTEEFFAKFPAVYEAGEVVGVGYDECGREIYRTSMRTAGRENRLTVAVNKTVLRADGEDFAFIDIAIADREGIVKYLPDRVVKVEASGAGYLQGFGSANPKNAEKFTENAHTSYGGRLLAVIRSGGTAGKITVQISSEGLQSVTLELEVVA